MSDDAQAIRDALRTTETQSFPRALAALDRLLADRDRLTEQNASLVARLRRAVEGIDGIVAIIGCGVGPERFTSAAFDPHGDYAREALALAEKVLADIAVGDFATEAAYVELRAALEAHRPKEPAECAVWPNCPCLDGVSECPDETLSETPGDGALIAGCDAFTVAAPGVSLSILGSEATGAQPGQPVLGGPPSGVRMDASHHTARPDPKGGGRAPEGESGSREAGENFAALIQDAHRAIEQGSEVDFLLGGAPTPEVLTPDVRNWLLFQIALELPTSDSEVERHGRLQSLHRRIIATLGLPDPDGPFVTSDYWATI